MSEYRPVKELIVDQLSEDRELLLIHLQSAIDTLDDAPEVAKAMLRNIRAALAAAPTPGDNGWMDIATAPKDGEWIMAWWPTMSITQYPCICYSDGSLSNPNAFETVVTNEYGSEEVYPAKWQPLPPPPAPPTGKGE